MALCGMRRINWVPLTFPEISCPALLCSALCYFFFILNWSLRSMLLTSSGSQQPGEASSGYPGLAARAMITLVEELTAIVHDHPSCQVYRPPDR